MNFDERINDLVETFDLSPDSANGDHDQDFDLGFCEIGGAFDLDASDIQIVQVGGGGSDLKYDDTLKMDRGVLSVNTIDEVVEDSHRPITSGAVYEEFSKAVALLKTI